MIRPEVRCTWDHPLFRSVPKEEVQPFRSGRVPRRHSRRVFPAIIGSGVFLLACFGLHRFVRGVDRETWGGEMT